MDFPRYPRESDAVADAYERIENAIHDVLASVGRRESRTTSLRERLGQIRGKDPFLNWKR